MAFKAGTVAYTLMDGVNAAGTNISRFVDNFAWPQTVQSLDVSAFGTAAKANIIGLTDGDVVTASGPYDATIYTHFTALKAAQSAGSSTSTITWGPGGSVASEAKVSAECWVTNVNLSAGVGGRVEYAASLQITGAVTNATW
jgi:hypothetical protein